MCAESVRARKVDELDGLVVRLQRSGVPLDRDARVIADALPQTSQTIEQSAFTGIRTADNRNAGDRAPAYGYVRYANSGFGGLSHQTRETRQ